MSSRAGWNGFAGRIWPADRGLEAPVLGNSGRCCSGLPTCLHQKSQTLSQKSQIAVLRHTVYTCHKTCITKHNIDITTRQKHRYNTISIFRNIFVPRKNTVVHLVPIKFIEYFQGNSKIFAIFFAPCVVIDSHQRRFAMNMQLRQCFARAKPFRLKKARKKHVWLFLIFKKSLWFI